jgi:hypothetical protein
MARIIAPSGRALAELIFAGDVRDGSTFNGKTSEIADADELELA